MFRKEDFKKNRVDPNSVSQKIKGRAGFTRN